jgi:hypothetical protein
MVDRKGVTLSQRTIKWLELGVVLVALGGPLAAHLLAVRENTADIKALKAQDEEHALRMNVLDAKLEQKVDKIDTRLQNIEASLNRIAGKLEGVTRLGGGQ